MWQCKLAAFPIKKGNVRSYQRHCVNKDDENGYRVTLKKLGLFSYYLGREFD